MGIGLFLVGYEYKTPILSHIYHIKSWAFNKEREQFLEN